MSDISDRLNAGLRDRYTVEHELGRGGMATVFFARDMKHQRSVALKVVHPHIAAHVGTQRFLRESQAHAQWLILTSRTPYASFTCGTAKN